MSMTLYLLKAPPEFAARIEREPELFRQVWRDEAVAAPDRQDDLLMEDYLDLGESVQEQPERYPWMNAALHGTGTEVAFDLGYGPGFLLTTEEVGRIAAGLVDEVGWHPGDEVIAIPDAIAAFYTSAAAQARAVIGGVG